MKQLIILIDKNGRTSVQPQGYFAEGCNSEKILNFEKKLGVEEKRDASAELYEQTSSNEQELSNL